MTVFECIELFATLTGVAYVVLEILHLNAMWVVGILTGAACAWSFGAQHLWASMGLNMYYIVMSVVGLIQWRRDASKSEDSTIPLRRLTLKTGIWSGAAFVVCTLGLIALLRWLGDSAPALDGVAFGLSIVGTVWLALSFPEQWVIWIVADIISSALCFSTGLTTMGWLYVAYVLSAVYGYIHWMRHGRYI